MCPVVYNNIYKGVLGEVIGRWVFEAILEIPLDDITEPEFFEKFDFKIRGVPAYVDFKHWKETDPNKDAVMRKAIAEKARACGAGYVIVANVMTEDRYRIRSVSEDGVQIIAIPSLLRYENDVAHFDSDALEKIGRIVDEWRSQNE